MTRYVIVRESTDLAQTRSMLAVYGGPGAGWQLEEAELALATLHEWLAETAPNDDLTVIGVRTMPDQPRGTMAAALMEAEAAQAKKVAVARASVDSVDPPTSELWESIKDTVTPDEIWQATQDVSLQAFSPARVREQVINNRKEQS